MCEGVLVSEGLQAYLPLVAHMQLPWDNDSRQTLFLQRVSIARKTALTQARTLKVKLVCNLLVCLKVGKSGESRIIRQQLYRAVSSSQQQCGCMTARKAASAGAGSEHNIMELQQTGKAVQTLL